MLYSEYGKSNIVAGSEELIEGIYPDSPDATEAFDRLQTRGGQIKEKCRKVGDGACWAVATRGRVVNDNSIEGEPTDYLYFMDCRREDCSLK